MRAIKLFCPFHAGDSHVVDLGIKYSTEPPTETTLTRYLQIRFKLQSLFKTAVYITNERDQQVFVTDTRWGFNPATQILQGGVTKATLQWKPWTMTPTSLVGGELGNFELIMKRAMFSPLTYTTRGGPFNGATVKGDFWQRNFVIQHDGRILASASTRGGRFNIGDCFEIELRSVDTKDKLFAAIAMVLVLLHRARVRDHADE